MTARLVSEPHLLEADRAGWDLLADRVGRPFCTSEWLLGWWRHVRPARAQLAVVLVHDGDELIGVAAGCCDRGSARELRWTPLGAGSFERSEPLAAPGREAEVAREVAAALHARSPRPAVLRFEGVPAASPWPALLQAAWPGAGRPRAVTTGSGTALVLDLPPGGYEAWRMTKTAHFRQRVKRAGRAAREAGAAFRLADAASAPADVEAFLRVHDGRWADRGGSAAIGAPMAAMLRDVVPPMVAAGRLRLWSLELDGEVIASSIVLRAGDEVGYWLNGFSPEHARLEPSKVSIVHVIEDAFALGARRLDLGEGTYAYKRRFADEEEELRRVALLLPGAGLPQAGAAVALRRGRRWAGQQLDPARREQVRALLGGRR